jgi:uncharacterized protein YeaO (DUF488 family)
MGKIYTSYYNKVKNLDKDRYVFIQISSGKPDWFTPDIFIRELFPYWSIINEWKKSNKDSKAWEEYRNQYKSQRLNHINKSALCKKLCDLAKDKDVVLLCHESPETYQFEKEYCHRFIVRDELNNCGLDVQELR